MALILSITEIRGPLQNGFPPAPDARDLTSDGIIGLEFTAPEMKAWDSSAADHQVVNRGAFRDMQGVTSYTGILKDGGTVGQYQGLLPSGLLLIMPGWPPTVTRDSTTARFWPLVYLLTNKWGKLSYQTSCEYATILHPFSRGSRDNISGPAVLLPQW